MQEESRRFFCRKENRDNAKAYLSLMSDADLNHLMKEIKRILSLNKIKNNSITKKDNLSKSFVFSQKRKGLNKSLGSKINRLEDILSQDWSHLFQDKNKDNCYYVYFHLDPTIHNEQFSLAFGCKSGVPFYVGKGSGDRAWNLKRNQGHGAAIRELLSKGYGKDEIVFIAYSGLTESKALEIESKLIYLFGSIYQRSRRNSILLNLDIPVTPF